MKDELYLKYNPYNIRMDLYKKMKEILNLYYLELHSKIMKKEIEIYNIPSYLCAIAEAYELLDSDTKWMENTYQLLCILRENISKFHPLAAFGGIAEVAKSVNEIYLKTGYFKKFKGQIDNLLIDNTKKFLTDFRLNNETFANDYDLIGGMTGVGSYLLDIGELNKLQCQMSNFFRYFLGTHMEGELKISNWFIKRNNMYLPKDDNLPYGKIDFGVAHGVIGPMTFAAKAYKEGITILSKESIEKAIKMYERFSVKVDNLIYWPGQMSFESYQKNEKLYHKRMSWCYGNIGISRCLFLIAQIFHDTKLEKQMLENIKNIANVKTEEMYLLSPILCHGFGGMLIILNSFYKEGYCNEAMRDRVLQILEIIVQMYQKDSKYGFIDYSSFDGQTKKYREDNSLIDGATGVILSLLVLVTHETNFEKFFLIR